MQVQLWSVGKASDPYLEEGCQIFFKRLGNYADFSYRIIPPVRNSGSLPVPGLKLQESRQILSLVQRSDYLVALDEKGTGMNTRELADFLEQRYQGGSRRLVFLIGGSYGLDEPVLERADLRLSLSPLTFPHQLVRLIMAEQLYRVYTLLHHEKYHHE